MAKRTFLHVGTLKSGTTFLQSLWWRDREVLAERGLLLPGRRLNDHFLAASLAIGREEVLSRFPAGELESRWDRLLDQLGSWSGDALISHELFSRGTTGQCRKVVQQVSARSAELHVVVTARDLARVVPSHWQQMVKTNSSIRLDDYWQQLRDDPQNSFWPLHDIPALLERWGGDLPHDQVHVVVVPHDAGRAWLWEVTSSLFGVDGPSGDLDARNPNESLGIAEVELLRRIQEAVPQSERDLDLNRLSKGFLAHTVVAPAGAGTKFVPPPALVEWARDRGATMASELKGRGYDVVGDLDDLVAPAHLRAGRTPDEVAEGEVLDVAVAALARFTLHERDQRVALEQTRRNRRRQRAAASRDRPRKPEPPPATTPRGRLRRWVPRRVLERLRGR